MKKLQTIVFALSLAALLCVSCSNEESEPPRPSRPEIADQTVLYYLVGTDLSTFFFRNIDDIKTAVGQDILYDSRVLIFTEPKDDLSMVIEVSYDPKTKECVTDTLRRWTNPDFRSTVGSTITEVITYMAEQAPAKRYGLILGSHAQGWTPSGATISSMMGGQEAYDDIWRPVPGALQTRWFGKDKSRVTEIPELKTALVNTKLHFEYLLFDACFMSSIEAMYELRGCADNIIASPCETMATGFPYVTVLPSLLTDKGKSYDLSQVCYHFYDHYANRATTKSGCIAHTVCKELEPLAAIVKRIEASNPNKYYASQLQSYEGLTIHVFYDLQDYIWTICSDPALRTEFDQQMAKTFPIDNRRHTPTFYSMYGHGEPGAGASGMYKIRKEVYSGVTTSAPSSRFNSEWKKTSWYNDVY